MCILASERLTHCPSTFGNDQLLLRNTSKHDYQGLSWLLPQIRTNFASCFVEEKLAFLIWCAELRDFPFRDRANVRV